jgi:hypothetical protein
MKSRIMVMAAVAKSKSYRQALIRTLMGLAMALGNMK